MEIHERLDDIAQLVETAGAVPLSTSCVVRRNEALDLVVDYQLPMWDGLILAVAAESRCRLLLSGDFQNGFTWRGVTVVDPFAVQRSPLLTGLLAH